MKVLITTDLYITKTNGVVTSVRNLMEELERTGHEVRILTVSEKCRSHRDGNIYYIRSVPLDIVYPDVRMPISYRHRYIKELIRWKPDVIHSQCEYFSYQFAGYIAKKTAAPIVHTYHTLYEQYVTYIFPSQRIGAYFVGILSKLRLRKAEAIVAPTQKGATDTNMRRKRISAGSWMGSCKIPSGAMRREIRAWRSRRILTKAGSPGKSKMSMKP